MTSGHYQANRRRLDETGIGFAGIEGAWWLPAAGAFPLPGEVARELAEIGRAIFTFFDATINLYRRDAGSELNRLLGYKVPEHILRLMSGGRVEAIRPDFQLQPLPGGQDVQPVITELEICPSAHGFAHAMQAGYGLPADLVEAYARYLDGRTLLFAGSSQWSEFLFEQLAFCKALDGAGARGRVLYDKAIKTIAEEVRQGKRWRPPMFGIPEKPAGWNPDVTGRIHDHGFEPYLWPDEDGWPADVGDAVVFRFGYFDCFAPDRLRLFQAWQAGGATLLNPAMFILDNKALMAALSLAEVREAVAATDPTALDALDRCLPETLLLSEETLPRLLEEKDEWVVKYAGYDGGDQAWGGRSLVLGAAHTTGDWRRLLEERLALPWPVVGQRAVPSLQVDIAYLDKDDRVKQLRAGTTRLRTFFLRNDTGTMASTAVAVCGSHVTVSGGTMQVSEAVDAVQAPVHFQYT